MTSDRITSGSVIDGRFEIERLASAGGMGDVFRAQDRRTGEPVAVKFVRNGDSLLLSRFEREAQTLAQLEHPGIVRYIAHGSSPSVFLAMEWLEGEDLSRRLVRGPLSTGDALLLTRVVAEALAAAHARGIIHRDIKPSNIFLVEHRIESAKLLDFGVAQVTQTTRAITGTGQLLGTLGYMAPEQALSGRNVTPAVDVYSLGCVLFECLTGQPPFAGEWAQVLSKILISDPPRLREVRRGMPLALDDLVARMLKRDPAARATLATVLADVSTFLTAREMLAAVDERSSVSIPAVTGDERRLVAVIVCDSGVLAEVRSEAQAAHSPAADTVPNSTSGIATIVGRFGGELVTVADGPTIVTFTTGTGGTDLATRAAKCALAIRDVVGNGRIALASGRGEPSHDSLVAGIVDRARALLAAPGEPKHIRIDAITAGLLDASFAVAGNEKALALVGEREHGGARKLLGKTTPCVGRERELATLDALVGECLSEPVSTALVITGNPGVGKSRVRHEILGGLRSRDDAPEVWMARGDPIALGAPYGMLAQLVRRMAGLDDSELLEVRRQKLLARVGRNLPIHDAMRVAEFLGELVRAEFAAADRPALRAARQDPAAMADQIRRAWDDLVAAETSAGPVVIVLEDLQWGDLPTVRLIDGALRNQRHRPLLVLSLARPEIHETFPGLFRDRRVHEIRLAELTPSAARRLVLEVLGTETDPKTVDALVEQSHGNAYYLEELIRAVAEGESALPETVLASAQARLQRLAPGARRILRASSVYGMRFWPSAIAPLLDAEGEIAAALDDLVQREVVVRQPTSRFRGEEEYVFRHVLVRDAAYEMLTERDRQKAHAKAAEWLEGNGEREALVLADHLERSGERSRAVVWYLWAAEQALEGSDLTNVVARAQNGIDCGAAGPVLGELLLLQAEASGWAGAAAHASLAERAFELLTPATAAWERAAAELSVAARAAGDDERVRTTAARVAGAALDAPSVGHAWARARIVFELLGANETALAARLLETLRVAARKAADAGDEDAPVMLTIVEWLDGATALHAGKPEVLIARAAEIAKSFEATGNVRWAALVALEAAIAASARGDAKDGLGWAERAGDISRRHGMRSCEIRSRAWLAWHLAAGGHLDAAITTVRSAVRDAPGDRVAERDARAVMEFIERTAKESGRTIPREESGSWQKSS